MVFPKFKRRQKTIKTLVDMACVWLFILNSHLQVIYSDYWRFSVKRRLLLVFLIVFSISVLIYNMSIIRDAEYMQDMIKRGDYSIVYTKDGSSGYGLDDETVEILIEILEDVNFVRRIGLRISRGWIYRLDIEVDDKIYEVVFGGENYIRINGRKIYISQTIKW